MARLMLRLLPVNMVPHSERDRQEQLANQCRVGRVFEAHHTLAGAWWAESSRPTTRLRGRGGPRRLGPPYVGCCDRRTTPGPPHACGGVVGLEDSAHPTWVDAIGEPRGLPGRASAPASRSALAARAAAAGRRPAYGRSSAAALPSPDKRRP